MVGNLEVGMQDRREASVGVNGLRTGWGRCSKIEVQSRECSSLGRGVGSGY